MRWLRTVSRHPRHALLFAVTAGLLAGPVSRAAPTIAAAAIVAVGLTGRLAAAPGPAGDPLGHRTSPSAGLVLTMAAALLLGALIADLRLAALEGGRLPGLNGRAIAARAVVLEPMRERGGGLAVARARLVGGPAPGEGAVLRIRASSHPGAWPQVGEIVAITGTVAPLGRFDAYQRRRGAAAAVEVSQLRATGARRGGVAGIVDGTRRRAETGLERGLAHPEAALLLGMVLGQDERLEEDVRDEFKASGLAHILAVSGQNVMLLATLVLGAGAVVGIGLRARLLLALGLVALYVPLTGAGPSIQRAGVMGAAGLVAALAGRPAHRWYALGLAAAVTLALNPLAAGEPGWQLSFAAVAALLLLAPRLREILGRALPGPVADVAAMTIAATIGTAPLMALHFGQVSLAALPANLLAAAAIAPIMWLGMLAAGAAQVAPALAEPFNALNAPLLAFVAWVARTMAAAPAAVLPLRIGSPAGLAAAYAALAAALATGRAARRLIGPGDRGLIGRPGTGLIGSGGGGLLGRQGGGLIGFGGGGLLGQGGGGLIGFGGGGRSGSRSRVALAGLVAVAAAVVIAIAVASSSRDAPVLVDGEVLVSFLDVGQGDATLIQSGRATVLVDTGPPGGPILRRLREAGVERLDGLVLTHAQTDHEGMALEILRTIPTRLVVDGGAGWPTYVQRGLPAAIAAARARRLDAHAGQVIRFGAIRMRLLWPPAPRPGFRPDGDPNDRAVVALVQVGDFDLFLPADAESNVTAALPLPPVEALKVAHHGSADDGLPGLLQRLRPKVAAIEVGRRNTYGHPTASTLAALRVVDRVYRTDRDGTVRLRVHRGEMRVEHAP